MKSNIWKIYLFSFLTNLHFCGAVLVPFFTDWGKINLTHVLILQSWFMFWIFALEIPTGTVADYLGRKHSLILGCAIHVVAPLVYVSYPSFYIFLLAEFLWAVSFSFFSGAQEAFVYDTLNELKKSEQSKKIFGRMDTFHLGGILIGVPFGSVLAGYFGLRAPVALTAVPLLAAFFVALYLEEPPIKGKDPTQRYGQILKEGMMFFYKHKTLKILAFDSISISAIAYFLIWLYQPLLQTVGLNIAYFGLVHASYVGGQILILNNIARLEKLLGSKKGLIFLSAAITGAAFIVMGLASSLALVIAAIVIGGSFGLSRRTLFTSYMNKYIPSNKRATVLSTVSMVRTLAQVIINPIVGYFANWQLKPTLVFLGIIAIAFSIISRVEEEHLVD